MATQLPDITGRIRIDTSGIGRAQGEARGLGSSIGGALAGAAKVGGLALAGLGIAGAAAGLKTAASMEQARISFTTMLGSAKKADVFLKQLSAFAAKTPFEFPELQTAASSLISAGIEANKVIPIMTSLGNATSGMGTGSEGVKRATVALQQMSAAGRITGEDLNQLRDAGIPVFDLLASATGKSKEAVAQLAQKGKLGKKEMEQLFKALETGKGLERFNGLMDKQSQSLTGLFSTLKDTVNMTLSNLVTPAIPAIKAGLAIIPGAITRTIEVVKGLFAVFAHGDFTGAFGRALGVEEDSGFVDKLFKVRAAIVGMIPTIKSLASSFMTTVVPAAIALGRSVATALLPIIKNLAGFWKNTLVPAVRDLLPVIGFVADILTTKVVPAVGAFYQAIQARVMPAIAGLIQRLRDNRQIFVLLGAVISVIADIVRKLAPIVGTVLGTAFRVLGAVIGKAIGIIGGMVTALGGIVRGVGFVLDALGSMFSALGHIPGFGWASDAAKKLHHAASEARGFADALAGIKGKTVTIKTIYQTSGGHGEATAIRNAVPGKNANGTTSWRGGLTWAGEYGPELIDLPQHARVFNAKRSAQVAAEALTPGGGNIARLHPDDISAIVGGIVRRPTVLNLDGRKVAESVDQHLGGSTALLYRGMP